MRKLLAPLAVIACTSEPPPAPPQPTEVHKPPLVFGVLPAIDTKAVAEDYQPLVDELAKAIGRPVTLAIPADYKALEKALLNGEIHVGQLSAHLYTSGAPARLRARLETQVLAQQRMNPGAPHRGVFAVKASSAAKKLTDLRGKTVAYVDAGSSSGYRYPRDRLKALGHDPETFFASALFGGNHEAVAKLVEEGKAEVGCISEQMLPNAAGLRAVEKSDPIPDDAIISLGSISPREQDAIREFLLAAHDNPSLRKFFTSRGIERYVAPDIDVYLKAPAGK